MRRLTADEMQKNCLSGVDLNLSQKYQETICHIAWEPSAAPEDKGVVNGEPLKNIQPVEPQACPNLVSELANRAPLAPRSFPKPELDSLQARPKRYTQCLASIPGVDVSLVSQRRTAIKGCFFAARPAKPPSGLFAK